MTDAEFKFWGIAIPSGTVILMRIWSMFEHRKTGKQITEIKLSINGELEKRVATAFEEGKQEGIRESTK